MTNEEFKKPKSVIICPKFSRIVYNGNKYKKKLFVDKITPICGTHLASYFLDISW